MSSGRHDARHARPRETHPLRTTVRRRLRALRRPTSAGVRVAAIAAPLVTLGVVGAGVAVGATGGAAANPGQDEAAALRANLAPVTADVEDFRERSLSRSFERSVVSGTSSLGPANLRVQDVKYATEDLQLRVKPREGAKVADTVNRRHKLVATGQRDRGFSEVRSDGTFYWVSTEYLADKRPKLIPTAENAGSLGVSTAPCPDSGPESGLTSRAVMVYRAVCHNFPQITSYGGYDGHGEHASGRAIDIMTSDVGTGTAIAEFLRAHSSELGLYDVIWRQQIWTPQRAGEGWRGMEDRGSATANHYDHVHVSVY